ncbi:MAG: ParB N-terminal domain-containing protein [Planctomycetota bacterium]|nr:ParB N-terminal domain-containing protein [Planctomycetota bacterium]
MTDPSKVSHVRLSDIKPSPENDQLYRPIDPDEPGIVELARSIMQHGVREPIVITQDNWILSGHRRYAACRRLGIELVPTRVEPIRREDDVDGFVVLLREYNRQRDKTLDEKLREELLTTNPNAAYRSLVEFRTRSAHRTSEAVAISGSMNRKRISAAKEPFLLAIKQVVNDLHEFWPISDRQIHYGLLNNPPLKHAKKPDSAYDNSKKSYHALVELVTRARLEGHIPLDAIADETRPVSIWDVFQSTQPFFRRQLDGFLHGYYRNLQTSQPDHVELVIEKNTVKTIVERVASAYCVPVTSGRGYCSLRPRYDIAQRYKLSGKDHLVLVVVSDFDPDGEEICQSLARSIRDDFGIDRIRLIKAALTREQTKQLSLPPALEAKASSTNFQKFLKANGCRNCWEVEALTPQQLQDMVRQSLNDVMDIDLLNAEIEQEKQDATQLAALRQTVTRMLNDLSFDSDVP